MAKKKNQPSKYIRSLNPYPLKGKDGSTSKQFINYQQQQALPLLVQPIISAKVKGFGRIAQERFDKLFQDLGLQLDYEALLLRKHVLAEYKKVTDKLIQIHV